MTKPGDITRIRYDEGCLAAHALNLIGDRWALLVVRELMFAPKRFQQLRAGMPGLSASVLMGRLTQLQEAGLLTHDPRLGAYALLEAGHALLPVLESLCRWALRVPGHDPRRFISPSALMISMGVTRLQGAGAPLRGGFDFGSEAFEMELGEGPVRTRAVARPEAAFVLRASGNAMAVAVYGAVPLAQLTAEGRLQADGDLGAAQAFVDCFRLAPEA